MTKRTIYLIVALVLLIGIYALLATTQKVEEEEPVLDNGEEMVIDDNTLLDDEVVIDEGLYEDADMEYADDDVVFCTMDAMECPDGSFVRRIPPDCEFEACPEMEEPMFQAEDLIEPETPELIELIVE